MSRDSADAVVVGGGVVGCSIAYHLARRGATVVLVERDTLGSQSTGRCAGGVRRQFSSSANVVMQQLSVELLAGLEAETGVDPEFRHIGYLFVLTSDKQVEDFRRFLLMWHETGVTDARWLEPHEVRELAPLIQGDDILGGTFCPSDGIASPHAVTLAYSGAARRLGVQLLEGGTVDGDAMGEVIDRRAAAPGTAGIQTAWAGLYEMTPDHQPILGPVDGLEGFWCACGFSGRGFQQAPAVGYLLAQWFSGEQPQVPLDVFAHRRFATGNVEPENNVV